MTPNSGEHKKKRNPKASRKTQHPPAAPASRSFSRDKPKPLELRQLRGDFSASSACEAMHSCNDRSSRISVRSLDLKKTEGPIIRPKFKKKKTPEVRKTQHFHRLGSIDPPSLLCRQGLLPEDLPQRQIPGRVFKERHPPPFEVAEGFGFA